MREEIVFKNIIEKYCSLHGYRFHWFDFIIISAYFSEKSTLLGNQVKDAF